MKFLSFFRIVGVILAAIFILSAQILTINTFRLILFSGTFCMCAGEGNIYLLLIEFFGSIIGLSFVLWGIYRMVLSLKNNERA